ncbi:hypothetical protein A1O1_01870 [Capronia coronata CBS 617.96]|uniref:Ubiquitin-like protease family profile domain-containing protein n=1 Tax=Capronia coronata CBS 617.96 TaxID=1182541 RepID=W9YLQ8_9EURO|nr:uncharacterized protein A1O1_01870 [Capronia coronata CBS 617.96]EXJ93478.1 hypothetical protein A1O1_01870 [Capronia coronata CBS 617.96]
MEAAFDRAKHERKGRNAHRPLTAATSRDDSVAANMVRSHPAKASGEKNMRNTDRLDPPRQIKKTPIIISGKERSDPGSMDESLQHFREQPQREAVPPQEPQGQTIQRQRITRSHSCKENQVEDSPGDVRSGSRSRPSENGALGEPWKNDLVYPGPGKKSATVPFEDLRRLDDDEFLNDNLISFFMQYLETYMEKNRPEVYKEMYFFNTYFYEALTKNVKGRKGINYDAVSRWTKNINIFKRKFVVVPVNENFHWYLAIICNLSYFLPQRESEGETEDRVDQTFGVGEELQLSDQPSEILENTPTPATEETQKSLAELSISDNDEKNSYDTPSGRLKKGPGRRKAIRRSLPKYDTEKPVIITLDSLGSSRSATCSLLRQYVVAEATNKQNLHIESSELKGMTAKQIPTQSNFSDCGLYLCMYLEQLVADPSQFVSRILQRQEEAQQWPRRIRSEDLRSRLRGLILELHRRQESGTATTELPEVGNIMIEREQASSKLAVSLEPRIPRTKQEIAEARRRYDNITTAQRQVREEGHSALEVRGVTTTLSRTSPTFSRSLAHTARELDDLRSDIGEDDDEPVIVSGTQASQYQAQGHPRHEPHVMPSKKISGAEVSVAASSPLEQGVDTTRANPQISTHSTPAELAANLRKDNELREARRNKKRRRSNDDSDEERRKVKEASASTDFLSGLESYAINNRSPTPKNAQAAESPSIRHSPRKKASRREDAINTVDGDDGLQGARKRRRAGMYGRDSSGRVAWAQYDLELEVPETQETTDSLAGATMRRGRQETDPDENNEMLLR